MATILELHDQDFKSTMINMLSLMNKVDMKQGAAKRRAPRRDL